MNINLSEAFNGCLTLGGIAVVAISIAQDCEDCAPPKLNVDFGSVYNKNLAEPAYPPVETNVMNRVDYASFIRNPLNYTAQDYDTSPIRYESRTPVYMNDPAYDAVGRIVLSFKSEEDSELVFSSCTGTYSEIDGYRAVDDQKIILSAGHCFDSRIEDGHEYVLLNAYFFTNYIDIYGDMQTYASEIVDVQWASSRGADIDMAVGYLADSVPQGMQPAIVIPDYEYVPDQLVSAPGFSGDVVGQHNDIDCRVVSVDDNWILNTCDIQRGASGGPLEIEKTDGSITFGGVLSAFYNSGAYLTRHSVVPSWFLDEVAFLERTAESTQCLLVSVDYLNVRSGPGVEFAEVANELEYGQIVYETDFSENWSQIPLVDGDHAYIARNYDGKTLAQRIPCL